MALFRRSLEPAARRSGAAADGSGQSTWIMRRSSSTFTTASPSTGRCCRTIAGRSACWHAASWVRRLLKAFVPLDLAQAQPNVWAASTAGAMAAGNANLTRFYRDGMIERGNPLRYADIEQLNNLLRERGAHSVGGVSHRDESRPAAVRTGLVRYVGEGSQRAAPDRRRGWHLPEDEPHRGGDHGGAVVRRACTSVAGTELPGYPRRSRPRGTSSSRRSASGRPAAGARCTRKTTSSGASTNARSRPKRSASSNPSCGAPHSPHPNPEAWSTGRDRPGRRIRH